LPLSGYQKLLHSVTVNGDALRGTYIYVDIFQRHDDLLSSSFFLHIFGSRSPI